jgi:hypothetical protein
MFALPALETKPRPFRSAPLFAETAGVDKGPARSEVSQGAYSIIAIPVANARGEGDYCAGLRPVCAADEGLVREPGGPQERSLKAALLCIQRGHRPEPSAAPGLLPATPG